MHMLSLQRKWMCCLWAPNGRDCRFGWQYFNDKLRYELAISTANKYQLSPVNSDSPGSGFRRSVLLWHLLPYRAHKTTEHLLYFTHIKCGGDSVKKRGPAGRGTGCQPRDLAPTWPWGHQFTKPLPPLLCPINSWGRRPTTRPWSWA